MRATSLLESQHRQIAALIEELEKPAADRRSLSERLATALFAHMVIEEEIFYPQAEKVQRELVQQGAEDHEADVVTIERLAASDADDERFAARLQVLKGQLQQHVNKEEGILFPAVNRSFTPEKNAHLGVQMKARFEQLLKAGHAGALKLRMAEAARRAPAGIVALGPAPSASAEEPKKGHEKGSKEKGREVKTCAPEVRGAQPDSPKTPDTSNENDPSRTAG